jgi:4-carboxymuconolactone decarboxylase
MKRIEGVSGRRAQPLARIALRMARRKTRQIAGAETERMIEPLEAYAHHTRLMLGYGALEEATARLHSVDHRLKVLAELKAATLSQCEYCIDIGSQIAARAGISEDQLLALPRYRESDRFGELEKLVLDYAVGMSRTPVAVSDELFARMREHFDEAQIVELTNVIALENMRGRFNGALGIGSSGFREGLVCAVPDRAPAQEGSLAEANGATAAAGAGSTPSAA